MTTIIHASLKFGTCEVDSCNFDKIVICLFTCRDLGAGPGMRSPVGSYVPIEAKQLLMMELTNICTVQPGRPIDTMKQPQQGLIYTRHNTAT
jgi:hypothetical protein